VVGAEHGQLVGEELFEYGGRADGIPEEAARGDAWKAPARSPEQSSGTGAVSVLSGLAAGTKPEPFRPGWPPGFRSFDRTRCERCARRFPFAANESCDGGVEEFDESVPNFRFSATFSARNPALSARSSTFSVRSPALSTRSSAFSVSSSETLAVSASTRADNPLTRANNSSYDERCDPTRSISRSSHGSAPAQARQAANLQVNPTPEWTRRPRVGRLATVSGLLQNADLEQSLGRRRDPATMPSHTDVLASGARSDAKTNSVYASSLSDHSSSSSLFVSAKHDSGLGH
jgi:hypothetical protein